MRTEALSLNSSITKRKEGRKRGREGGRERGKIREREE
jgi:hypothetical protein